MAKVMKYILWRDHYKIGLVWHIRKKRLIDCLEMLGNYVF